MLASISPNPAMALSAILLAAKTVTAVVTTYVPIVIKVAAVPVAPTALIIAAAIISGIATTLP